jgi:uncharacterized protein
MHWEGQILRYAPSDLTVFLDGEFPSWMDRWYANQRAHTYKSADAKSKLPMQFGAPHRCIADCSPDDDAQRELIARKGTEHERTFLATLKNEGCAVFECPNDESAATKTFAAMRDGAHVIYQACLQMSEWGGYADFLAKLVGASQLGDHHYEVWDTKLARSPKPYFLVQLCAYAEMLQSSGKKLPGVDFLVSKPFLLEHLREAISTVLPEPGSTEPTGGSRNESKRG